MMELKIVLAMLLPKFNFKPVMKTDDVIVESNAVAVPYPGLNIEISELNVEDD